MFVLVATDYHIFVLIPQTPVSKECQEEGQMITAQAGMCGEEP